MACANITAARTAPDSDPPYTEHQCSLVAQFSGDSLFQNGWIADAPSAGCSGLDDGASICSDVINAFLSVRVSLMWERPDAACPTCLSLQQALALIVSRQGTAVAGLVLDAAVGAGMPAAQAEALATANGIPLDTDDGGGT
ncbi:MAG: hypothetical protein ABSA67_18980 [Candidatus Brocadiia bacterium]|jgi:hypothetical protein